MLRRIYLTIYFFKYKFGAPVRAHHTSIPQTRQVSAYTTSTSLFISLATSAFISRAFLTSERQGGAPKEGRGPKSMADLFNFHPLQVTIWPRLAATPATSDSTTRAATIIVCALIFCLLGLTRLPLLTFFTEVYCDLCFHLQLTSAEESPAERTGASEEDNAIRRRGQQDAWCTYVVRGAPVCQVK